MKKLYERYFQVAHRDLPKRQVVWRALGRYLQRFIPRESTVLDLGAGYCVFINNIEAKGRYAVDQDAVVREHAAPGVIASVHDVSDLREFRDGMFDVVFASNLLEHLDDDVLFRTLEEVYRVTKPGGKFMVLQPNFAYAWRNYFDDFTHRRVFTHISLRDVLTATGFTVTHLYPKFLPTTMRSRLPVRPWLINLYLRSPWKPFAGQMFLVAEKR